MFGYLQQHRESLVLPGLLSVPQIQTHGLVWLFETDSLRQSESHSNWSPNFQPWLTVDNVWVIESLLIELAQNTFQLEMSRRQLARPQDVMQSGRLLTSGIQRFLNAADSVGRRDLGIFVLHTARQLLHAIPTTEHWLPEVNQQSLRLAERTELLRAGMAIFHQTAQLHQWQQEAIATGFYDEEYQAAQFWKSLWEEANGEDTWLRVSERIKNSASLLAAADSE